MHALQAASFGAAGAWPYAARCMLLQRLSVATARPVPAPDALKLPVMLAHTTQAYLHCTRVVCLWGSATVWPDLLGRQGRVGDRAGGIGAGGAVGRGRAAVAARARHARDRLGVREVPAFRCARAGGACVRRPVQAVQACEPFAQCMSTAAMPWAPRSDHLPHALRAHLAQRTLHSRACAPRRARHHRARPQHVRHSARAWNPRSGVDALGVRGAGTA